MGADTSNRLQTPIRRAQGVVRRVANEPIGSYKSPYGPK